MGQVEEATILAAIRVWGGRGGQVDEATILAAIQVRGGRDW